MCIWAVLRRWLYLSHRWLGVVGCVLMFLWFVSGMVMLFVGYPKLTPQERFALLPPLNLQTCCAAVPQGEAVALTTVRGEPTYVVQRHGRTHAVSAVTGLPRGSITTHDALQTVRYLHPDVESYHDGVIQEDRWTHSRGLDPHRPLHRVQLKGTRATTYYVSSVTGQIVLDAPVVQQRWNYIGAWLHWLYMVRSTSVDPVWTWTVIVLSAMCTLLAISGTMIGVLRWRFRSRYRSGARTPYRERWLRWHHVMGLCCSGFVCTWIFSGLMSMNPGGMFSPSEVKADRRAYVGTSTQHVSPQAALGALRNSKFDAVELQWRTLEGNSYVVAYDASAESRLVVPVDKEISVQPNWQPKDLSAAVKRLFPHTAVQTALLTDYDAYYYARHSEAMNGGAPRGLPALRVDAGTERAYIDLRTGDVVMILSTAQRVGRWLFYFLHSWDLPAMLRAQTLRDATLLMLCIGGMLLAITGIAIGSRRLLHQSRSRE